MTHDLSGKIIKQQHTLPIRIYYEDTDFSGRVYHANYLRYCERGRTDFLRCLNIHHSDLENQETPQFFIVRHMDINFLAPAKIDDIIEVKTTLTKLKAASFILNQTVYNQETLLFQSTITCALVNKTGKPSRINPETRAILETMVIL